ncbi:MAG: Flp family type IVb pilin [Neomegalonema sp.]|nr:Flp family type IVb pilin [Neomegalonema sp.]
MLFAGKIIADLRAFSLERRGATAIEYALIAGIVSLGILGTLQALGGGISGKWSGDLLPKIFAALN